MKILLFLFILFCNCHFESDQKEAEYKKKCRIAVVLVDEKSKLYEKETDENKKRELSNQMAFLFRALCPNNE